MFHSKAWLISRSIDWLIENYNLPSSLVSGVVRRGNCSWISLFIQRAAYECHCEAAAGAHISVLLQGSPGEDSDPVPAGDKYDFFLCRVLSTGLFYLFTISSITSFILSSSRFLREVGKFHTKRRPRHRHGVEGPGIGSFPENPQIKTVHCTASTFILTL